MELSDGKKYPQNENTSQSGSKQNNMTEATQRIHKFYGPPASSEQIKLSFET